MIIPPRLIVRLRRSAILPPCWPNIGGKPAFIRIIKEEFVLEMWLRMADHWMLFKTYPIAGMSGDLVPKEREGDCLQVYPFRLTAERMEADSPHLATWRHLLPGWQYTEKVQAPCPDTDN